MSQKNETPILLVSLLITAGLLGAGFWWFTQRSPINFSKLKFTPSLGQSATNEGSSSREFSQVQNVPAGLFRYGGSSSWAPIRLIVDTAMQKARPELRLQYIDPSQGAPQSSVGIKMLLSGQTAFAQSARLPSNAEYQQARHQGAALRGIPVAIDGVAFAVNPSLNIPGLTIEQLKGIYTGQITNWQQVGGPDLPMIALSRDLGPGTTFVEEILAGQALATSVQIVPTTTQALRKLMATPGGIYFASAAEIVPQCQIKPLPIGRTAGKLVAPYQEPLVSTQCPDQRNRLNTIAFQRGEYPITRNLFVIVKQNGHIEQTAGEAYANLLLSNQGQELIEQAGFVRIR